MTDQVAACPCHACDICSILAALEKRDIIVPLIDWLSGKVSHDGSIACGKTCKGRIHTSFYILNAIRDACRPFLEANSKRQSPQKQQEQFVLSYEEAFPELSVGGTASNAKANNLVWRKKKTENIHNITPKAKKRIRPVAVAPVSVAAPSWGISIATKGNLVGLTSHDPIVLRDSWPSTLTSTSTSQKSHLTTLGTDGCTPPRALSHSKETSGKEDLSRVPQLNHLVDLHCALIDNCLVPSSALELHLLFRLLSLKPNKEVVRSDTSPSPLRTILSSQNRCIIFAKEALMRQSHLLKGFGPPLWNELVQCPPFLKHLPSVAKELQNLLEKHSNRSDATGSVLLAENQTALITLPFKAERDSRHNYRTIEEQALYRNRETSRDAFLYQLRAFLNLRGKVVDASHSRKAIETIQHSSRSVVGGLMGANLAWFSEFFCDLLLQIGLVPLQETDMEVLRIADKDKLQKLHRRFSSKTSLADKSSRKVVADSNRSSNSPKDDAQHLFPGHQEFFYLFLISADSYAFGIHLRCHLIGRIVNLSERVTLENAEKAVLELRMMARFMGVLFFSPNWRSFESTAGGVQESMLLDGLINLSSLGLCVVDVVEKALSEQMLLLVVPWVVELLRMTVWDPITTKSTIYRKLLSLLRQVQRQPHNYGMCKESPITQLVTQSIEFLFGDVVGLGALLDPIPGTVEYNLNSEPRVALDRSDIVLSAGTLFACAPHVEDLVTLISSLSRPELPSMRSPGVSRKLRPSAIRPTDAPLLPNLEKNTVTLAQDTIQARLRDNFFHQHNELKELCEYAISKSLRNFSTDVFEQQIIQSLKPLLSGNIKEMSTVVHHCQDLFQQRLQSNASMVLSALAPPAVDQTIMKVAVMLAVDHGIARGERIVGNIVAKVRLSGLSYTEGLERKQLFADEAHEPDFEHQLHRIVVSIRSLVDALGCLAEDEIQNVLSPLQRLISYLDSLSAHSSAEIPHESLLRPFFLSILTLDQQLSRDVFDRLILEPYSRAKLKWQILKGFIDVAEKIRRWSRHGLSNLQVCLQDELQIEKMVRFGISAVSKAEVTELFCSLVKARVLNGSQVKSAQDRASARRVDVVF
jgi:hypothetical protein